MADVEVDAGNDAGPGTVEIKLEPDAESSEGTKNDGDQVTPSSAEQVGDTGCTGIDFTADDTEAGGWENETPIVESTKEEDDKGDSKTDAAASAPEGEVASYPCDLCKGTFKGQSQEVHEKTAKHQKMLARLKKYGTTEVTAEMHTIHCHICGTISNSQEQLEIHKKGSKHRSRCQNLGIDPDLTEVPPNVLTKQPGGQQTLSLTCNICKVVASSIHQLNQHLAGKKHKEKMRQRGGTQDNAQKQPLVLKQETEFEAFQRAWNDGATAGLAVETGPMNQQAVAKLDGKPGTKRGPSTNLESDAPANKRPAPVLSEPGGGVEMFHCLTCNIFLNSQFQMNEHMNGKVHMEKLKNVAKQTVPLDDSQGTPNGPSGSTGKPVKKQTQPLACKECRLLLNSQQQYDQHMKSKKHQMHVVRSLQPKPQYQRSRAALFGYSGPGGAPHFPSTGNGRGLHRGRGGMARGNMTRGNMAWGSMEREVVARDCMEGSMGVGPARGSTTGGLLPPRPRPSEVMGLGAETPATLMQQRGSPGIARPQGLLDTIYPQGRPRPMSSRSPLMGMAPSARFQDSQSYPSDYLAQEINDPAPTRYEDAYDDTYGSADMHDNVGDSGYLSVDEVYQGEGYCNDRYDLPGSCEIYDDVSRRGHYSAAERFSVGESGAKFDNQYDDFCTPSRSYGIERYGERRSDGRHHEDNMSWGSFY